MADGQTGRTRRRYEATGERVRGRGSVQARRSAVVRAIALVLLLGLSGLAGCSVPPATTGRTEATGTGTTGTSGPVRSGGSTPGAGPASPSTVALAALEIDDGPPPAGYLRELFPTWKDTDHNGCDAREDALAAASHPAAERSGRCKVVRGSWVSAYDGLTTTDPGALDIDHVVPLANAWRSGADRWTTDQRALYANDQADLWVVSAGSNRSKGDRAPDEWRPPRQDVWCEYATRWVGIKQRWHLTATTAERDALGQMLDTCPS